MAQDRNICSPSRVRLLGVAVAFLLPVSTAMGSPLDDFLKAADKGLCIESVTFRMIRKQGPAEAAGVVEAALEAYGQRELQQRSLGCEGDIAAQAIAAGAEPEQVLKATAAGL